MRISWRHSAFFRLQFAFVSVIVVAASVAAMVAIVAEKTVVEDRVRADLQVRAETALHDVHHYLEDRAFELRSWSSMPTFDEILVGDRSLRVQNALLALGRRHANHYRALAALDRDGQVVAHAGEWSDPSETGRARPIETSTDRVAWTRTDRTEGASGAVGSLFVSVPIESRLTADPIGWLVAEIDWRRIEGIVRSTAIGGREQDRARFLVLVDDDDRVLAGPAENRPFSGTEADASWIPAKSGTPGVDLREARLNGYLATRFSDVDEDQVADGQFSMIAYWQESDAFRAMRFLVVSVLGAGALGIVIASSLAAVLARRFTDRIRSLGEATARLAEGDLEHRVAEGRPDEFGALARSFNEMTARIGIARHRTEEATAEWRSLVEHAPVTIVSVAPDETVRFINRVLPGFVVEDVVGSHVSEWIDPEHRARVLEVLRTVLRTGEPGHLEGAGVGGLGTNAWYSFRIGPVIRDGKVVGANLIATDISDKRKLQQDILDVSETERERVGRDLHDDLGQVLTGIALLARSLEDRLRESVPDDARTVGQIHDLLRSAIEKTRRLARGLYPVAIIREGLDVALRDLAEGVEELSNVKCTVEGRVPLDWSRDPERATHLFRIVQEAIQNALKHARPRRVSIRVERGGGGWSLTITDDGTGVPQPPSGRIGLGLRLMSYRAAVVGGRFAIDQSPTGGTIVSCRFMFASDGPEMQGVGARPGAGATGRSQDGRSAATRR